MFVRLPATPPGSVINYPCLALHLSRDQRYQMVSDGPNPPKSAPLGGVSGPAIPGVVRRVVHVQLGCGRVVGVSRRQSVGAHQHLTHGRVEGGGLAGQHSWSGAEGVRGRGDAWSRKGQTQNKDDRLTNGETVRETGEETQVVLRGAHANVVQTLTRSAEHLPRVGFRWEDSFYLNQDGFKMTGCRLLR